MNKVAYYKEEIYKVAREKKNTYMITDKSERKDYNKQRKDYFNENYKSKDRLKDEWGAFLSGGIPGAIAGTVVGKKMGYKDDYLPVLPSNIGWTLGWATASELGKPGKKRRELDRQFNLGYTGGKSDRVKYKKNREG